MYLKSNNNDDTEDGDVNFILSSIKKYIFSLNIYMSVKYSKV